MLATSLKTGTVFKEADQPWLVEKYEHTKTARGGATIKVKARNLLSNQVLEKRYQSAAKIDDADVHKKNIQYLYQDGQYHFMDPETFEQFELTKDVVGESAKFLQEGETVQVTYFDGSPVLVDLPMTIVFEVAHTVPGFKGNTISSVYKEATLTNGTVVKVPTFVKEKDRIKINTSTGEYTSKA